MGGGREWGGGRWSGGGRGRGEGSGGRWGGVHVSFKPDLLTDECHHRPFPTPIYRFPPWDGPLTLKLNNQAKSDTD